MKYNLEDKFFPNADNWMWGYCEFLGKYISEKGDEYDLGILVDSEAILLNEYSFAIVYDNIPGSYISGYAYNGENELDDIRKETLRRARLLNIISSK